MNAAEIPHIDKSREDKAVSLWRSGELVAIPTETVYGLAADAENAVAVARIYSVKSRPRFNPLITHVPDAQTARRYGAWNDRAEKLAAAFWPGPLTLVLPRAAGCKLADLVSAGGATVALRVPAHPVARQLLAAFGGGLAAPSANRSGRVSPTSVAHVLAEFGETLPLVIDGGPCQLGLESTVIDLSGEVPALLRPGTITRAQIEAALGEKLGAAQKGVPRAPGQLASHYAPSLTVRLNATSVSKHESLLAFGFTPLQGAGMTLNLSKRGDLAEAAANLFGHLRALDKVDYANIAVMPIPDEGIGEAINDRLRRAAARR